MLGKQTLRNVVPAKPSFPQFPWFKGYRAGQDWAGGSEAEKHRVPFLFQPGGSEPSCFTLGSSRIFLAGRKSYETKICLKITWVKWFLPALNLMYLSLHNIVRKHLCECILLWDVLFHLFRVNTSFHVEVYLTCNAEKGLCNVRYCNILKTTYVIVIWYRKQLCIM